MLVFENEMTGVLTLSYSIQATTYSSHIFGYRHHNYLALLEEVDRYRVNNCKLTENGLVNKKTTRYRYWKNYLHKVEFALKNGDVKLFRKVEEEHGILSNTQ